MVKLKRAWESRDSLRKYAVLLDNKKVAEIAAGQEIELNPLPGKHTLALKIDWCGSNTIEFISGENTLEFECGNNTCTLRKYQSFLHSVFSPNDYLWLDRVVEK